MKEARIIIDGKQVLAREGELLLFRALQEGFFIPNLCAIEGVEPPHGSCRLCWVEVEGRATPTLSCALRVWDGMKVQTRSEAVDRLVRSAFEMLLSTHRLDCKVCEGNRRCALQQIAKLRKISLRVKRLPLIEPDFPVDDSRSEMGFNPNHCVLCGRCVHVCNNVVHKGVLDYTGRGLKTMVGTFDGQPLAEQACGDCTACALSCPVGALYLRK